MQRVNIRRMTMEATQIILIVIIGMSMIGGFFAVLSHLKSLESIAKNLKDINEKMNEKK